MTIEKEIEETKLKIIQELNKNMDLQVEINEKIYIKIAEIHKKLFEIENKQKRDSKDIWEYLSAKNAEKQKLN